MSRLLAGTLATVLVLGLATCATALVQTDPLGRTPGLRIARRLAADAGPIRVWNTYNVSGSLIAFARGREGQVRLVVDGRSDLWGAEYIDRIASVQSLGAGWQAEFDRFRPDVAVLPVEAPLVVYLLDVRHWRFALRDDKYAMLVPPGSAL